MQGVGLFTMEELKYSPSGLLYTRGPSQYKIPAVCDVPLRFNVYLLPDSENPHAIYSSKVRGHTVLQEDHVCALLKACAYVLCGSAGYWRTHGLPRRLCLLRHQGRCGCRPLRVRCARSVQPQQPRHAGESLSGLLLSLHQDGTNKRKILYWQIVRNEKKNNI